MSKCDLELDLDRPDRVYRTGDAISGIVGVSVNKDCACNGLLVTLEWKTHGSGNSTSGGTQELMVYQGEWKAGDKHFHPFDFTIPNGPITYHGTHLNVDWRVKATADLPWAFDPEVEDEIEVKLADDPPSYSHGNRAVELNQLTSDVQRMFVTAMGIGMSLFACVFLAASGGLVMTISGDPLEMLFGLCFSAVPMVMIAAGLGIAFWAWRDRIAERRIGEVTLHVPDEVRPGDVVPVAIAFTPAADVPISRIIVTLTGKEVCVAGSGTNTRTYTEVLHTHEELLSGPDSLRQGKQMRFDAELHIPHDAPFSFSAPDNQLKWVLDFHVDIPRWPDWERSAVLEVGP